MSSHDTRSGESAATAPHAEGIAPVPAATGGHGGKPRWLFIDSATAFGGHEVMLLRLIEELSAQAKVTPMLLARADSMLVQRGRTFLTTDRLPPATPRARNPLATLGNTWRMLREIRRIVREERPALCVVATGHLGYLATMLATRLAGRPTVVYVPLVDSFATMGYRLAALKDAIVRHVVSRIPHAWITITADQARSFAAMAQPTGPVFTLPNTVDPVIEAQAALPAGSEGDVQRVLVFGRLDASHKGLDLLLDHLESVPHLVGTLGVSIVGDGPYGEVIRARMADSPVLSALVQLSPWSATVETMRAHDVLLLPSRFEGVPLVMLEAMALGLPVVASELPGTRGHLPAEALFPIGDMEQAFAKIAALREPAVREAMIARNREHFAASSSGAAFAKAVARLSEQLFALQQGKTGAVRVGGDHFAGSAAKPGTDVAGATK